MEENPQVNQILDLDSENSPIVNYPDQPNNNKQNTDKDKFTKFLKLALVFFAIMFVILSSIFAYKTYFSLPAIQSYEECVVAKGSSIQESYPPVCITKSGLSFTQELSNLIPPSVTEAPVLIGAEECYEQAINLKCPEGVNCMLLAPEDSFCQCMGGFLERAEDSTFCIIDEIEYGGISFAELDQGWYWASFSDKKPGTPVGWVFSNAGTRSEGWYKPESIGEADYLLTAAEGSCSEDSQCYWADQGCGGGHGVCTNNPEKYEDLMSTCEINEKFPANLGYSCGCVEALGQCAWKK